MDFSADVSNAVLRARVAQSPEQALVEKAKHARSEEEIENLAQEFEAMAIAQFLAPLFADLKTEPPFGGGHGEEVMRGMLVDEYAKEFAKAGGIGIADQLKTELLRAQENYQQAAQRPQQGAQ